MQIKYERYFKIYLRKNVQFTKRKDKKQNEMDLLCERTQKEIFWK